MKLISIVCVFIALSGCYQSRVIDCPFEQGVDHLEQRYGTELRSLGGRKLARYVEDSPLEYSREEQREMFDEHMADPEVRALLDGMFKQRGIKEEMYFDSLLAFLQVLEERTAATVRTVSYEKGKMLRLELRINFIGQFKENIVLKPLDNERSRLYVDQHSSLRWFLFSMMRGPERKFLQDFSKEIQSGAVKQHYRKKKSLMSLVEGLLPDAMKKW